MNELLEIFEKKKKTLTLWKCFRLRTSKGRQQWIFEPEPEIKNQYQLHTPINWNEPGPQQFLNELDQAFTFNTTTNPNAADRVLRHLYASSPNITEQGKSIQEAFENGILFYSQLQTADGNWPGDYGGPMFLLPGLIITAYVTGEKIEEPFQTLLRRYILNHQRSDGGWGLHIEGESTMFGTVMHYVSLRLMGMKAEDPVLQKARTWIISNGGATGTPSWGKFYLSVLGVYDWKGCDTLLPELWLLPRWLPIHPGRYWCHTRMVYLPMSYAYGEKITMPENDLIREIRTEIYTEPYDQVNWKKARNTICSKDVYTPKSNFLKTLYSILNTYEKYHIRWLRKKALRFALQYIETEDLQTNYINIGPVNKVINSLCVWHAHGKDSEAFKKHKERWSDYLWIAEDGMKMNGYNGSQLWDTMFAGQAILENPVSNKSKEVLKNIYHYAEISQIQEDPPGTKEFFRHTSKGGWPFSTLEHGWPITDCTSEGLKTSLKIHELQIPVKNKISDERLHWSADLILSFQNKDGGWASYENTRAPRWLEMMNPSEVFGDIMIDYSYVECSSASMQALAAFSKHYPNYKKYEIQKSLSRGAAFIRKKQREDGSWLGSWAVCFTYATWFGVDALLAAGANNYSTGKPDAAIQKACEFLRSKQRDDGGWGESFQSSVQKKYIESKDSQIVNTSWALLTLMAADYPDKDVIDRGIKFLVKKQELNGDWPQEQISGVFNFNCMITYSAYRNVFPLWALGRYLKKYGNKQLL